MTLAVKGVLNLNTTNQPAAFSKLINPLLHNGKKASSKLKAFADDKLKLAKMMKCVL